MHSMKDQVERFYSPQELARLADVSPATIAREVRRGRLRGFRVGDGRLIRIPESAWRTYLAERGLDALVGDSTA